jgi:hypothetical protein
MTILIHYPALDERIDGYGQPQEVLRGTLDIASLRRIGVDIYQRKRQTPRTLQSIVKGFRDHTPFQDIALGMRGARFRDVNEDTIELLDPTYVIDGYHRIIGAIMAAEDHQIQHIRLGAQVFFNTTLDMERDWFKVWNINRKGISPSVLIRNEKETSRVAGTLYGMSQTEQIFPLYKRVAWDDRPGKNEDNKDELVRGMLLLRVVGLLHGHKFGRQAMTGGSDALTMLDRIDKKIDSIGLAALRKNLIAFFQTVESCWPYVDVTKHAGRLQLREPFLFMLARLLSDHELFWEQPDEKELVVPTRALHDFRRIDLTDPNILNLLHRGRSSADILYNTVLDRLNHGRSTNRLVSRWQNGRMRDEEAAA